MPDGRERDAMTNTKSVWLVEVDGVPVSMRKGLPEPKPLVGACVVQDVLYVPAKDYDFWRQRCEVLELAAIAAAEKAKTDARALWAVRVLLSHAAEKGMALRVPRHDTAEGSWAWIRLASATLYPDLSEQVRRELGEEPT